MYRAGGTTSALPRPIPEAKPDRLLLGAPAGKRRDSAEDEARGSRPAGDWLEGRIVRVPWRPRVVCGTDSEQLL